MKKYGMIETKVWNRESDIKKKLFEDNESLKPQNLYYFDIPHIYRRTLEGYAFLKKLDEFEDKSIFNKKSIQVLIDFHYRHWNKMQNLFIGIPMSIQLLAYWYWSNFVIVHIESNPIDFRVQEIVCRYVLVTTASWLILVELTAIIEKKLDYFKSFTQLFNVITPALIMWNLWRNEREITSFWTVQTFAALVVWLRFLFYLRTVETFSWMVHMITACI